MLWRQSQWTRSQWILLEIGFQFNREYVVWIFITYVPIFSFCGRIFSKKEFFSDWDNFYILKTNTFHKNPNMLFYYLEWWKKPKRKMKDTRFLRSYFSDKRSTVLQIQCQALRIVWYWFFQGKSCFFKLQAVMLNAGFLFVCLFLSKTYVFKFHCLFAFATKNCSISQPNNVYECKILKLIKNAHNWFDQCRCCPSWIKFMLHLSIFL